MNPPPPSDSIDENLRKEFERRWLRGRPGDLAQFLPPKDDPRYLGTLEELVHIEIEMAWKQRIHNIQEESGSKEGTVEQPPPIESYVSRFSDLDQPEILARLLKQECLVRKQVGIPLSQEICQARFPDLDLQQAEILPYLEIQPSDDSDAPAATLAPEDPGDDTITLPLHFADYELLEELGRGSMGIVYRAKQISNPRIVAIKILRSKLLHSSSMAAIKRFQQEIRAVAKLRHDNIVSVFDVNENKGHHYFSMQYVRGKSLANMALRRPIENHAAAHYLEQIARAISYAHRSEILHRDLKPANILIDDDTDRALVADFGLAKISGHGHSITAVGETVGTPSFMSPEQVQNATQATEQSDIYSLGATLYAILCGKPPFFAARSSETFRQLLEDHPASLRQLNPHVDKDLETICMKCLQKRPSHRYLNADALAADLDSYLRGGKIQARPSGQFSEVFRCLRRNRRSFVAAIIFTSLLIVGSLTLAYQFLISTTPRSRSAERMERAEKMLSSVVGDLVDEQSSIAVSKSASEKKMLQQLRGYYASLLDSSKKEMPDPQLTVNARLQMSRIDAGLGNFKEAERLLLATIGKLQKTVSPTKINGPLPVETVDDHNLDFLARAWFSLGIVDEQLGNVERAMKDFRQSTEFFDHLTQRFPKRIDDQIHAASCYAKMGSLALSHRRWTLSKGYFEEAARRYQQILRTRDPQPAAFRGLANCYYNQGEWERLQGNQRGYREHLEASVRELQHVIDATKYVPSLKTTQPLVISCRDLGNAYALAKNQKTAIHWYEKAFQFSQHISVEFDSASGFRALQADVLARWAVALSLIGRNKEAREKCQIALKRWRRINEQQPVNSEFVCQEALAMGCLAEVQLNLGNSAQARENLARAKQLLTDLVRTHPGEPQFSSALEKILRLHQQVEN